MKIISIEEITSLSDEANAWRSRLGLVAYCAIALSFVITSESGFLILSSN